MLGMSWKEKCMPDVAGRTLRGGGLEETYKQAFEHLRLTPKLTMIAAVGSVEYLAQSPRKHSSRQQRIVANHGNATFTVAT